MWYKLTYLGCPTSMSVLLDWITTKNNYDRFNRGTRNNVTGETKYAISMEIVNAITEAGIIAPRSQEAVIAKISQLETDYDSAHDWLIGVGSTIANEATVRAALLMRCRYYYDLYDVMQDRALYNYANTTSQTQSSNSPSHHDHNVSLSGIRNNEQNDNSTSFKNPVNLDSNSDTGIQEVEEEDQSDSDDGINNNALSQHVCKKSSDSERNKMKRFSNVFPRAKGKKAKTPVTTPDYCEMNDPSHGIMSEWLKANSAIHCEEMKEKAASCRIEERKLKREMKISREDHDMHKLKKQRMQMKLAMELARNRMELRESGVSEAEINVLLPLDFLHDKKANDASSDSESSNESN